MAQEFAHALVLKYSARARNETVKRRHFSSSKLQISTVRMVYNIMRYSVTLSSSIYYFSNSLYK